MSDLDFSRYCALGVILIAAFFAAYVALTTLYLIGRDIVFFLRRCYRRTCAALSSGRSRSNP